MLVAQFGTNSLNHRIHLILKVEFLLLQPNFLHMIMLRHVAAMELLKLLFIMMMFLGQAAILWTRGHQMVFDLLLLHHHAPPSLGVLFRKV
jgi:hypothetical protein